jgi:sulfite reductase (NADPH) hemoprotein beta-component
MLDEKALMEAEKLSQEEYIKENSNFLRGTITESLRNPLTGALSPDDIKLIKFHGSYQQQDRDLESERRRQKLEPLYQFMVRVRVAGGITSSQQWVVLDKLADGYGNGTMKLTTRQSFQFHGILKRNIKPALQAINDALLTTIATCGDVNRNVMCNPNPYQSQVHGEVYELACQLSEHLKPKTRAYHEIWLGEKKVAGTPDVEPLYQSRYLPRKFKIALTIPPHNDIDVFANDLGFIAIEEKGRLLGFNVCVGGGLGNTLEDETTYPRLADVIGFVKKEQIIQIAETVIGIQRDYGNRVNRKNARLKYTIDQRGLDWFTTELHQRLGWELEKAASFSFKTNGDIYGWHKGTNGKWFLTLFVENGRVKNTKGYTLKDGLREVAALHASDFRLTGNQNLIIGNVEEKEKESIEAILKKHGILNHQKQTGLRLHSMACVALNTCGLAFAEAERYLPSLIDKLDKIMATNGLEKEAINIRMTGCPNGCARSYLGEIGFVGRAVGRYNLYLGASHQGDRLNALYKEMLSEEEILAALTPIIEAYSRKRKAGEHFGDFVLREGYIQLNSNP